MTKPLISDQIEELRLFPLRAVLYPGGPLRLRIFEPRYLRMVRDCAARDEAFGVTLLIEGDEDGDALTTAEVGTSALITDFSTLPDGLLGISAQGQRRFSLLAAEAEEDGLLRAEVRYWRESSSAEVGPQHALLVDITERLLEQFEELYPELERSRLQSADYVGMRLAEMLPLELDEKQSLLELSDPQVRLDQLLAWLPRFQSD